jgi:hypothetical protein
MLRLPNFIAPFTQEKSYRNTARLLISTAAKLHQKKREVE